MNDLRTVRSEEGLRSDSFSLRCSPGSSALCSTVTSYLWVTVRSVFLLLLGGQGLSRPPSADLTIHDGIRVVCGRTGQKLEQSGPQSQQGRQQPALISRTVPHQGHGPGRHIVMATHVSSTRLSKSHASGRIFPREQVIMQDLQRNRAQLSNVLIAFQILISKGLERQTGMKTQDQNSVEEMIKEVRAADERHLRNSVWALRRRSFAKFIRLCTLPVLCLLVGDAHFFPFHSYSRHTRNVLS